MAALLNTRQATKIWLIGSEEYELTGSKLPSNKQVLSVFFYHHKTLKKTIRESCRSVIKETITFWEKARIPVRHEQDSIKKLEKLYEKWTKLKKNSRRKTTVQKENECTFSKELDNLFDIAHQDALQIIKIQEDKDFLLAQREPGRRGCLGSVDLVLATKEKRVEQRKRKIEKFKQKTEAQIDAQTEHLTLSSDEHSGSECEDPEEDVVHNTSTGHDQSMVLPSSSKVSSHKRTRKNIITPSVAMALDRVKLSDRKATYLLAATAECLGHKIDDLNINKSSIRRNREKIREEIATSLKNEFQTNCSLVVHWDGKLLPDLTGNEKVDRLPIIVSGLGINQLLGVPKLHSGTGDAQATAVATLLEEWGIKQQVNAMCFDTTASNTGHRNGACILLEQKLQKDLLYLACRHHILEIVLAAVFNEAMRYQSSGPDVAIFKRFKQCWSNINQSAYECASSDANVMAALRDEKEIVSQFAVNQLKETQVRDDYRELLELAIIYLGGVPPRGVHFMSPGAIHHARWMAKALYSLKMWMFRGQFKLTKKEENGLSDVCIFLVRIYLRAWFTAPLAISAPYNDLRLLQQLSTYEKINPALSKAASKKFEGHLWYLSEELVGLAFFDENVPLNSKKAMIQSLTEKEGVEEPLKRIQLSSKSSNGMQIEDFVTKNTIKFFHCLGIPRGYLDLDPEEWHHRSDYQQAETILKHLRVVNDNAERGVALMQEYNALITKKEDQKQYLLQVVEKHRQHYPDCKKRTLD